MTERSPLIDCVTLAGALLQQLSVQAAAFRHTHGRAPGLALLAGDESLDRLYVRKKLAQCERAGIRALDMPLAGGATTSELETRIRALNADDTIDGIFLQWPLPANVDPAAAVRALAPAKDVDGMSGCAFTPAAAAACVAILRATLPRLEGLRALVAAAGEDLFVQQIARILRIAGCAVTVAYRNDADLPATCRSADILIAALGRPEVVRGDWLRPGATVIDVGMHAITGYDGRSRFVGDVRTEEAVRVARAITPVPGGVGPVTIACLLENTLAAARQRAVAPT